MQFFFFCRPNKYPPQGLTQNRKFSMKIMYLTHELTYVKLLVRLRLCIFPVSIVPSVCFLFFPLPPPPLDEACVANYSCWDKWARFGVNSHAGGGPLDFPASTKITTLRAFMTNVTRVATFCTTTSRPLRWDCQSG